MKDTARKPGIDAGTANGVTALELQVLARLTGQIREFQLVLTDGGLILRGRARTYYAKQLAQHAVMDATGLPIVANEIEVY